MKLELYYRTACPYSAKVMNYIESQDLQSKMTTFEVDEDAAALDRLVKANGDNQVPCLFIDGKPLLESDDIISWLDRELRTAA